MYQGCLCKATSPSCRYTLKSWPRIVALLIVSGVMAVLALLLFAWAMLPFMWAESGPKGFDVISPLVFWSLMAASAGLTYFAWRSFKAAVAVRVRWALGIAVVTLTTLLVGWNTVRRPTGAQPLGGGWYIVTDSPGAEPRHAFYRRATIGYSRVDAEVSWFRLVDGDCLVYAHEYFAGTFGRLWRPRARPGVRAVAHTVE